MLINNIEMDVKTKCIERETTQLKIAEGVGTTPSYVNRIVKNKEQIVNKTFIAMLEQLGYDVKLTYVKKSEKAVIK
jgi:transcriptional regulator with XRE-family HTH domain